MLHIAIVGRPNVGKSALLNRLAGKTVSIVHDQPGVTRDRISSTVIRSGRSFEFVDTGGIGLFETENTPSIIASAVQMQAEIAIESADIILLVVDGLEGLRPLDQEIAQRLRKSGKRLCLLINKLDIPKHDARASDFFRLGLEPVLIVSASHGRGIQELWKALETIDQETNRPEDSIDGLNVNLAEKSPRIAIVGRPNVGKSSLTNRLLGAERVIVSEIPGTTRDSVELSLRVKGRLHYIIDTAGIRHKTKIRTHVEMYSRHWTEKTISRCDLALLMFNAPDGPTRQDREIASMIQEHRKPCILLVNKWDLNETLQARHFTEGGAMKTKLSRRRSTTRADYEKALRAQVPFLDYAPLMFISALEGYHAQEIWNLIGKVSIARNTSISTGILNRIFHRAQQRVQPPYIKGRRLKIYYVTQKTDVSTPTFVLFVNHRALWVESYGRYLVNQLREIHPMLGCPILFHLREREGRNVADKDGFLP